MMEYPNYYAVIPADVRYSPNLTASQKLFYGEVSCLTLKTGECWASNKYFADLYGVDEATVSRWLKALVKEGFVDAVYNENTRIIKVRPLDIKINTPLQKSQEGMTKKSNIRIQNKKTNKNIYTYGEYSNVRLSDDERSKLDEQYGPELTQRAIDWFDAYIEEKGYKCKSHYLAMKRWVFDAIKDKPKHREEPESYEMDLSRYE